MKRTLIVAAIGTLLAGAAAAQNVTVYGRLNTSIERQKNYDPTVNGSVWVLQNNASRLGFKGNEDLGGGLKAGFVLEHRFSVDTGASTNGTQRIMEIQPGQLHERVSVVLGSKNEVERVTAYHREAK